MPSGYLDHRVDVNQGWTQGQTWYSWCLLLIGTASRLVMRPLDPCMAGVCWPLALWYAVLWTLGTKRLLHTVF